MNYLHMQTDFYVWIILETKNCALDVQLHRTVHIILKHYLICLDGSAGRKNDVAAVATGIISFYLQL